MHGYHIEAATQADQTVVRTIFIKAASRFGLVDTFLACRWEHMICNYSEGLGWGFGLGAVNVGSVICVGLNPTKATPERYRPVFEFIVTELTQAFGHRVSLAPKEKEIDASRLPTKPITEEMRTFTRKLIKRNTKNDITS
ncbi:MAG: hypothetical protein JWM68_2419 [Verrucomicrobiales bacterium]|nr:hypothetical protein [Verrucomicrobiales bacterium]